jgi:hypothetical protein
VIIVGVLFLIGVVVVEAAEGDGGQWVDLRRDSAVFLRRSELQMREV